MSLNPPQSRPVFFSGPALIVLAGVVMLALYMLYPRSSFFENLSMVTETDALSIAYLEALVAANPDNDTMRVSLARMYTEVGQFPSAQRTLTPLRLDQNSELIQVEVTAATLYGLIMAATDRAEHNELRQQFHYALAVLARHPDRQQVSLETLTRLFAVTPPEITADLMPSLLAGRPKEQTLPLQQQLASAQAASGNPGSAADTLDGILHLLPQQEQAQTRETLIELFLGAGQADKALSAFLSAGLPDDDAASLRRGIELARHAGNPAHEQRWLEMLVTQRAADLHELRRMLDLQLGNGMVMQARTTAEQMRDRRDLSAADVVRVAQVFEWTGAPDQALEQWLRAYQLQPEEATFQRAKLLATSLYQWATLITLLEYAARHRPLSLAEYRELATAHENLGALDESVRVLQQALTRFPNDNGLREQLVYLCFNDLRYPLAITVLEAAPELSDSSALMLANLYWRTRQPEKALEHLQRTRFSPEHIQQATLMKFNIASALGEYESIRYDYRYTIAGELHSMDHEMLVRLLNLAYEFDEFAQVARIGSVLLARGADPSLFSSVAAIQADGRNSRELKLTLTEWQKSLEQPENHVPFLIALAAYFQLDEQPREAQKLLRRALRLNPASGQAMLALGWLNLGQPEPDAREMSLLLTRLSEAPEADSLPLLLAGAEAQHNGRAAHHWRKHSAAVAGDPPYRTASRQRGLPVQEPEAHLPEPHTRELLQAGAEVTDIGRMSTETHYLAGVHGLGKYKLQARVADVRVTDDSLLLDQPLSATESSVSVYATDARWQLDASVGEKERKGYDNFWGETNFAYQLSSRWTLGAGHEQGARAMDSAEAWWLASKDRIYLSASYRPATRLIINGSWADITYSTARQTALANGSELNLQASYQVRYNNPTWLINAAYSDQSLTQLDELDSVSLTWFIQPVTSADLLAEDYRHFSLGSRWQHGQVDGLDVPRAGLSWFVDLRSGYALSSDSLDFSVGAGVGTPVLGRDRLALSASWRSDTLDGSASANVQATYTYYFSD